MFKQLFIIVFIVFLANESAHAQGPPINTDTPILLGLEGSGVRSFTKIISKSINNGDANSPDIFAVVVPIAIPVNLFSDKFQAGLIIPFKSIEVTANGKTSSNRGIGDGQIFIKYLLYQKDAKNETFRIAAKTALKFASGDETTSPALGTGSTDIIFSTVAGWIKHRMGIYLETKYALNGTYKEQDFGDVFSYNFAFAYRLLPEIYNHYPMDQLNLLLELNGRTKFEDEISGVSINGSDGTTVFLSPGIQFAGGAQWLVESSFQ